MNKINQDEVNALLAAEIRKFGLNDAIKHDVVREKVMKKIQEMNGDINEMENPAVAQGPTQFPNSEENEEQFKVAPGVQEPETPKKQIGLEPGSQPLNVPYEPKMAIIPEVPDFLKDVNPGQIFVYDFNELSVGGENLSNKPFKTLEDPEVSKSMQQMWSENGITKSEVYQAKFEKIGHIVFDYKSGMSQFIEKRFEPDFEDQQQYKENPYMAEPTKEIESYIKQNVDINKIVHDVVTNVVRDYFLTNSERAINDPNNKFNTQMALPNDPQTEPTSSQYEKGINKAIQESEITTTDLIHKFKKVDTPKDLIETIEGVSNKATLVLDSKQIKAYKLNEDVYYFHSNPMSIRKCYVR
jgi:hypothetical protein